MPFFFSQPKTERNEEGGKGPLLFSSLMQQGYEEGEMPFFFSQPKTVPNEEGGLFALFLLSHQNLNRPFLFFSFFFTGTFLCLAFRVRLSAS